MVASRLEGARASALRALPARLRAWLWPLGALCAIVIVTQLGLLKPLERDLQDFRFELLQRPAGDSLLLVEIDPRSLDRLEVWPWPRRHHAAVIDRLLAAGATRVAFDVDFSSPSNPEDDALLEAALARAAGRVVLPVFRQPVPGPQGLTWSHSLPLERFRRQADLASVNVWPESDGLVRRLALRDHWPAGAVPSLSAVLAGREQAPFDLYGVDFAFDPASIPRVSFADVLRGTFDPALVAGRQVVIGATAAALRDDVPVPVYTSINGVLLHALGAQTLAEGRALQSASPLAVLLLAGVLGAVFAGLTRNATWRRSLAAVAGLAAGLLLLSLVVQTEAAVLLDVLPAVALLLLLFAGNLIKRIDRQSIDLFIQNIRMRQLELFMRNVVESSFDGILTIERDGRIRTANRAAGQTFGEDPDALVGQRAVGLIPELADYLSAGDWRLGERPLGQCEMFGRRADGRSFPLEVGLSQVATDDGAVTVAILRDITERKRHEAELEHQAMHDALTGLPNRVLLADRLERAVTKAGRNGKPVALLLLDLDRFKAINDTLGHQMGDRLLCQVAERLTGPLRASDTIARLGGDEFAVVLSDVTDLEAVRAAASRVVESLCEPFPIDDLSLEIGASIGIAVYPQHAAEPARLLQCADVAMYLAKREGGGVAVYDSRRDHNSVRHLTITGELRKAIEAEQLCFHYQPKIDLASGRVIGVEALIRWMHPELGFVPPDEFILHAEQTGLIEPITFWGFEQACSQYDRWRDGGLDFGIAVNLSVRCLHDESIPGRLIAILERWSVPPEKITVEITETAIMSDPERVAANVGRLHDYGMRLSVDDFGTGHSSLAYLRRLPLNELKIDRSFVMQMTENDDDAVIVRSTVDLAHSLGLKVVAEGVESERHLKILRALDCDTAQGYFIGRPMTEEALRSWHGDWAGDSAPAEAPPAASLPALATA